MSFLENARNAIGTEQEDEQWVYNRSEKLQLELNLGAGVRLEVTYYDKEDTGLDNIEQAVLFEGGSQTVLSDDDIQTLAKLNII